MVLLSRHNTIQKPFFLHKSSSNFYDFPSYAMAKQMYKKKMHFKYKDSDRPKDEGQKKTYHAKHEHRKAAVAILRPVKINVKASATSREEEEHFTEMKESTHQDTGYMRKYLGIQTIFQYLEIKQHTSLRCTGKEEIISDKKTFALKVDN